MNQNGYECDKHSVWWVILLIILFILTIIIIIIIIIIKIINSILNYRKVQKQRKEYTIFDLKYTNITFKPLGDGLIITNKQHIYFEEDDIKTEIPVNKGNRQLICIGNKYKTNPRKIYYKSCGDFFLYTVLLQYSNTRNFYFYGFRQLSYLHSFACGCCCLVEIACIYAIYLCKLPHIG